MKIIPLTGTASAYCQLTEEEIQHRWSKGLCFKCDEKFGPGHRCKNKQLQVLILADEEDCSGEDGDNG